MPRGNYYSPDGEKQIIFGEDADVAVDEDVVNPFLIEAEHKPDAVGNATVVVVTKTKDQNVTFNMGGTEAEKRDSRLELAYILRNVVDPENYPLRGEPDVAPGFRKYYSVLVSAERGIAHPIRIAEALRDALDVPDIGDVVDVVGEEPPRPGLVRLGVNLIRRGFQAIRAPIQRLFEMIQVEDVDDGEVPWLVLKGKGARYKDELPKRLQNRVIPPNACAYRALACAGVPQRTLGKPEDWVSATVGDIRAHLDKNGLLYDIYDGRGRLILRSPKTWYPGGPDGPAPERRPGPSLLVCKNHVRAFWSPCKPGNAFDLVPPEDVPVYFFREIEAVLPLRGSITLETGLFCDRSGIQPVQWCRPGGGVADYTIDLNKAYQVVLIDTENVFPVPDGTETIREYDPGVEKSVKALKLHGFYLIDVTEEEAPFFAKGAPAPARAWILGGVVQRLREGKITIHGDFIAGRWAWGEPLPPDVETAIAAGVAASLGQADFPPAKAVYSQLRFFSGYLDKEGACMDIARMDGMSTQEVDYLVRAADDEKLHEIRREGVDDSTPRVCRTKAYQKGGGLAKRAIYNHIGFTLLEAWRGIKARDGDAELIYSRTDSLGYNSSVDPDDLPFVGPENESWPPSSPFKVEGRGLFVKDFLPTQNRAGMTLPVVHEIKPAEALAGLRKRLLCIGRPGSGKTRFTEELAEAYEKAGVDYVYLTPTLNLKDDHDAAETTQAMFRSKMSAGGVSRGLAGAVVIIDEAGLVTPSIFRQLRIMRPAGIVLTGDPNQLGRSDLLRIAAHLDLEVVRFHPHPLDRFGGEKAMHHVLDILEAEIGPSPYYKWPAGMDGKLAEAGLRYVAEIPDGATVVGWRHKETDGLGATVHSLQGQTVEGDLCIVDYHCDPRLLYTAISRVRSLGNVTICAGGGAEEPGADHPEQDPSDWE